MPFPMGKIHSLDISIAVDEAHKIKCFLTSVERLTHTLAGIRLDCASRDML